MPVHRESCNHFTSVPHSNSTAETEMVQRSHNLIPAPLPGQCTSTLALTQGIHVLVVFTNRVQWFKRQRGDNCKCLRWLLRYSGCPWIVFELLISQSQAEVLPYNIFLNLRRYWIIHAHD
ncbi:flotillin-2 [Platysternon megacephalum]|uniref:Flotillin-2 n=1 Tax=Platysternon megacephalum TaxID=55544 RepID=A0A4D9E0E3_9SAUR|nr:flotillin-2 [Platysternon megacephalum]